MTSDLGEKIKALRLQKQWTQQQLAQKIGIDKSGISQFESCLRLPSMETLIEICSVFNVSADYLLGTHNEDASKIGVQELSQSQVHAVMVIIDEFRKVNADLPG